ncbi:MAG: hypothetical protein Q9209_006683 [Squamulea sp. 1 TL-2023]
MSNQAVKPNGEHRVPKLPLSHNNADSEASALRLVLTLFPDWETADGQVEFIRFKEGITNTLLKAIKRRPGYTEKQIDEEAVLIRAYGKGTDVLIDRERMAFPHQKRLLASANRVAGEAQSHSLLCTKGLAPELLARFQNGLIYRFIRGQVCQWHAVLPVIPAPTSNPMEGTDDPLFAQQPSQARPSAEVINGITPAKIAPNVWTVMQKWIFALPTATESERHRNKTLQRELERTVTDLADFPSLGNDGLVFSHCDLLSGNVIVHPPDTAGSASTDTVSFIDYEYATPAPAAFDLANHFAEWGGFECNYKALPTRAVRRAFIEEYFTSYASHTTLPSNTDQKTYTRRLFDEVDAYRGVPGLYWGIWALIQATISQIDFDYASYAEVRLQEYWDWRAEESGDRAREGRDDVKVHIKSRLVTVEGPRGKLQKDLSHLSVCFSRPNTNTINIELHHGARKNVATLRTVKTLINNLIIGVTKGYKYKMRYVYAHFPINVNIEKNSETGLFEVDIRYVADIRHMNKR